MQEIEKINIASWRSWIKRYIKMSKAKIIQNAIIISHKTTNSEFLFHIPVKVKLTSSEDGKPVNLIVENKKMCVILWSFSTFAYPKP